MGNPIQSTTPDLFSTPTTRGDGSSSALPTQATAEPARYFLPKDLPQALKALSDQELDQLSAAVLVEQQRRGKNPPSNENAPKGQIEEASPPMSVGKINAVRAAFKAGLKPSQIARQFRLSQSDVRKALADVKSKRKP